MAKFCIFCGNTPQDKNKEHVLPQWLSKHTERFHKVCSLGSITDANITFSALTFPACTACNDKFGKLEAAVKPILLDLMDSKPLNAEQVNMLLDWFDKVRVGLWLSKLTLSKQVDKISPKFHIADRVGTKDRMLIIERLNTTGKGLSFAGVESEMFSEMPSVFMLVVNDFVFINASELGLTSNKLGFPQLGKIEFTEHPDLSRISLAPGRNKTTHPVVADCQASPTRTIIYQPIFRAVHNFNKMRVYNTPYVMNHSLDFNNGVGGIFYQRNDNEIKYLSGDKRVTLAPRAQDMSRIYDLIEETHKLQNYVFNSRVKLDGLDKQELFYWKKLMAENELFIDRARQLVKIKSH